jgi:hypothetical protein
MRDWFEQCCVIAVVAGFFVFATAMNVLMIVD